MRDLATRAGISKWLGTEHRARLWRRLDAALARARASGVPALVSSSFELRGPLDLAALVLTSHRSDEPWFCLEQADHDAFGLAALGAVRTLEASGRNRFARLLLSGAASLREL